MWIFFLVDGAHAPGQLELNLGAKSFSFSCQRSFFGGFLSPRKHTVNTKIFFVKMPKIPYKKGRGNIHSF
jgi:hypothetical protein